MSPVNSLNDLNACQISQCHELPAQGRTAAGLVLLALHLGAWELADSIIMAEIPGTHAYVAALSVLGGIATFNNPLQVCAIHGLVDPVLTGRGHALLGWCESAIVVCVSSASSRQPALKPGPR